MRPRFWKPVLFVIAVASVVIALRQHLGNAALREEVARAREKKAELENLREEHATLVGEQLSPDELAQLRTAQAEAAHLRAETAALRSKSKPTPPDADRATQEAPKSNAEPWTNAGRGTPDATFRTGVWAAMHGETETLANLITFDADGRTLVDAMFARLPEATRVEYGTAEKVFATLLAVRLPQDLTSAEPIARTEIGPGDMLIRLQMKHADARVQTANFHFTRETDGWRIMVPSNVVDDYQHMLTSAAVLTKTK